MIKLKDIKINVKLTILLNVVFIVLMGVGGAIILNVQKKQVVLELDNSIKANNQSVHDLIEINLHTTRLKVQHSLLGFEDKLMKGGFSYHYENKTDFIALTNDNRFRAERELMFDKIHSVVNSPWLMPSLKYRTGYGLSFIAIYQPTAQGYVCVNAQPKSFIGTVLPNDLPDPSLVKWGMLPFDDITINNQHVLRVAKILDKKKFESNPDKYQPIVISIGATQLAEHTISNMMRAKNNFVSGYSLLTESDGSIRFKSSNCKLDSLSHFDFFSTAKLEENKEGKLHTIINDTALTVFYKKLTLFNGIAFTVVKDNEYMQPVKQTQIIIILIVFVIALLFVLYSLYLSNDIRTGILKLSRTIDAAALGKLTSSENIVRKDEVGVMSRSLSNLMSGLTKTTDFAKQIGNGNYNAEFKLLSNEDALGKALIEMSSNLQKARSIEQEHKKENEKQEWVNIGLAKFGDVLRSDNSNIDNLAFAIMKNLIDYLQLNQGGIFIKEINKNSEEIYKLKAAIAYDRSKLIDSEFLLGEALVGRCAFEKKSIYMTDLPQEYISITSGLGHATPTVLLLVPLIANNEIQGVIELASFNKIDDYKIAFVEKLGESIASALESVAVYENTEKLLAQSKTQSEELAAQEEEMRQNLEELQATQEDFRHRETDYLATIKTFSEFAFMVKYDIKGNVTEINNLYAAFLGIDSEGFVGKTMDEEFKLCGNSNSFSIVYKELKTKTTLIKKTQVFINNNKSEIKELYSLLTDLNGHANAIIKLGVLV